MRKKLKNRCGETLVEVLVSVVIIALSATLLATMISAAVQINTKANAAVAELYNQLSVAESGEIGEAGTVTIVRNGVSEDISVEYYRTDSGSLTSFGR